MSFSAGQILIMNLRDAVPGEANKRARPCIVVQNPLIFDANYSNVIVVPLTTDNAVSLRIVRTVIEPTPENGCSVRSYALSGHVASNGRSRIVSVTNSRITDEQLASIRAQIVLAIAA